MLKEEKVELLIGGKPIENDYIFTADNEKMTITIEYTFDTSKLAGKSFVTFEELYDLSNPDEPVKVAEHKDIEDDGQTVAVKEKPEATATYMGAEVDWYIKAEAIILKRLSPNQQIDSKSQQSKK